MDAFKWLLKFAGQSMKVMEAMGNYTVRTADNKVVLSSASSPSSTFYCPAEKLKPHVGHEVECVIYGEVANVSIECIQCNEILFSMDAPSEPDDDGSYPYQEPEEGGEEA